MNQILWKPVHFVRVQTVLYWTAETKLEFIKLRSHIYIETSARSVKSTKKVIFQHVIVLIYFTGR